LALRKQYGQENLQNNDTCHRNYSLTVNNQKINTGELKL